MKLGFWNWYTLTVATIAVVTGLALSLGWLAENAWLFEPQKEGAPKTVEEALDELRKTTERRKSSVD